MPRQPTTAALLEQIRTCQACATELPLGPRPVLQFDPQARLLIAAQAPGRKVHETGIPFNDASGERLRDWLGIDRAVFYDPQRIAILPMAYCFPGTGKSGDLPPPPRCAELWRTELMRRLTRLELTLVIGQYALAWHLPELKGRTLSAAVRDWPARWPHTVVLPHPSPRNNRWLKQHPWFATEVLPRLRARVEDVLAA